MSKVLISLMKENNMKVVVVTSIGDPSKGEDIEEEGLQEVDFSHKQGLTKSLLVGAIATTK